MVLIIYFTLLAACPPGWIAPLYYITLFNNPGNNLIRINNF